MNIFLYILAGLAVYLLIVFVFIRLFVPFMGYRKFPLPQNVPVDMVSAIQSLESRSTSAEEYLKNAYDLVTSHWHASRLGTIFYAPKAFRTNLENIWRRPGFAHCNTQNYLLFVLLIGSKFFKEEDIKPQHIFFNFFIHQYLKVRVGDKHINVDPAGASIRGKPFGTHLHLFG
jgi:hypothetical protein